jgi:hypothetical protein
MQRPNEQAASSTNKQQQGRGSSSPCSACSRHNETWGQRDGMERMGRREGGGVETHQLHSTTSSVRILLPYTVSRPTGSSAEGAAYILPFPRSNLARLSVSSATIACNGEAALHNRQTVCAQQTNLAGCTIPTRLV